MQAIEAVRLLLRPLSRRVALLVGKGDVRLTDDTSRLQRIQADFLKVGKGRETRSGLERFGEFGWTSRPPKGSELVALFFGGSRDHGVVVAVEDRATRPTGLEEGESCAYNAHGVRILLKVDGSIEITAPGGVTIAGPRVQIDGDLGVGGSIEAAGEVADALGPLSEMRDTFNLHTHPGVETGSGTTAPPALPMA